MAERLHGKVAAVSGGASGIGWAIAERFLAEGARLVLGDANRELLAEREREGQGEIATITIDVRRESEVEAMTRLALERFDALDVGVNSAGLGTYAPIADQSEEQWDTVIDVCLKGVFLCMKHEARCMRELARGGVIVNIASLNAFQPAEGMSAYCAAKAGVEMITRVGAMELGRDRIRVCGIAPGLVDTPLTNPLTKLPGVREGYLENIPLERSGTTQDIASAALFLASDDASWISGTTLSVDGGAITKRYPEFMKIFGALTQPS